MCHFLQARRDRRWLFFPQDEHAEHDRKRRAEGQSGRRKEALELANGSEAGKCKKK